MPKVQWKAIRPPKYRPEEFTTQFRWAMERTLENALKDFQETCKDFEEQPTFQAKIREAADGIEGQVATSDENYARLNKGVPGPYKIPKAGPGLLVFRPGYKAKTMPGVLSSRSGGAYGDVVIVRTQIEHPGFEGRHFDKLVAAHNTPWFKYYMAAAMRQAARKSGHGAK